MPYGGYGIRRIVDASQRFLKAGLPVYLRRKNFVDNPIFADLGLKFIPTTPGAPTGTTDFLINPPPDILLVSFHSLAMAQAAGVQIRQGARKVNISHTWIKKVQAAWGFATPQAIFTDPQTVGIVTDNLLLEIVSYIHKDAYGEIIEWNLICNASELSGAS